MGSSVSTLIVPAGESCCSFCSRFAGDEYELGLDVESLQMEILWSSIGMKCAMIMRRGDVKRVHLGRDVDWSIIVYPRDLCTCRIARFVEVRGRVERMVYFEVE